MPKEITHWWLVLEILESLNHAPSAVDAMETAKSPLPVQKTCPVLASVLSKNRNAFLLGSVGPDFLFYYLHGSEKEKFRDAGMFLHGSEGNDTLTILSETIEEFGDTVSEAVWAFLFGYACHVMSDSVFHPLVLYCVGKGDAKALYNHHFFESTLDMYVIDILKAKNVPRRIARLFKDMEIEKTFFLKLVGFMLFDGAEYEQSALKICLKRYARMQASFWNPLWRNFARLAGVIKPSLRHFGPAFYQKISHKSAYTFCQTFNYQHPVTGAECCHSIADLKNEVVRESRVIAEIFETILTDSSCDPVAALEKVHGPNLETGLHGDNAKKILYTAPDGFAGFLRTAAN